MDCLKVDISRIASDVAVKVSSMCDIAVSAIDSAIDNLRVSVCGRNSQEANVAVAGLNGDVSASVNDAVGNVDVKAYIVCGTNLSDEYYLLVEEGYTLTIEDEYITVLRNAR